MQVNSFITSGLYNMYYVSTDVSEFLGEMFVCVCGCDLVLLLLLVVVVHFIFLVYIFCNNTSSTLTQVHPIFSVPDLEIEILSVLS